MDENLWHPPPDRVPYDQTNSTQNDVIYLNVSFLCISTPISVSPLHLPARFTGRGFLRVNELSISCEAVADEIRSVCFDLPFHSPLIFSYLAVSTCPLANAQFLHCRRRRRRHRRELESYDLCHV